MEPIGKGSKFLFLLAVNGLGEMSLADNDVDFRVDFFARQTNDSAVKNFYTVKKSDAGKAFPKEDDDDAYFVICDTTNLDLGTIGATLTVEYTDEDTNARLKEAIPLTSNVKVINAPVAPIHVSYEVVQVVNDSQDLVDSDEQLPLFAVVQGDTNLWKYINRSGSNSWDDDGPDVSEGMAVVNRQNNHVYIANANGEFVDMGKMLYVMEF